MRTTVFLFTLAAIAGAQTKPAIKPADYGKFETLGATVLSPDGKWLAAPIRRNNGTSELRVHPTLIPEKRLLANVEGAMNAVVVHGDAVGTTLVDALENTRNLDLGLGVPINFGRSDHQALHKLWGTQLDENGKFQSIDLE